MDEKANAINEQNTEEKAEAQQKGNLVAFRQKNEQQMTPEEAKAKMDEELQKIIETVKRTNEIIATGKGRLTLEKAILSHDKEIKELAYDFTDLTGMEYTEAMDGSAGSDNIYHITYRQALNLFAKAAEKQTEDVDMKDIVSQIGITDSVEAVQLATLFFRASTQAGRQRISKM